jgi:hypothetical protein
MSTLEILRAVHPCARHPWDAVTHSTAADRNRIEPTRQQCAASGEKTFPHARQPGITINSHDRRPRQTPHLLVREGSSACLAARER